MRIQQQFHNLPSNQNDSGSGLSKPGLIRTLPPCFSYLNYLPSDFLYIFHPGFNPDQAVIGRHFVELLPHSARASVEADRQLGATFTGNGQTIYDLLLPGG
jgi:hypothetical protein